MVCFIREKMAALVNTTLITYNLSICLYSSERLMFAGAATMQFQRVSSA